MRAIETVLASIILVGFVAVMGFIGWIENLGI